MRHVMTKSSPPFCDLLQAAIDAAPASEKHILEAMFKRNSRKVIVTADSGDNGPPPKKLNG
jgi:hypothetical protein